MTDEMMKFVRKSEKPFDFWVDTEKFTCHGRIPTGAMEDIARMTALTADMANIEKIEKPTDEQLTEAARGQDEYMHRLAAFFDAVLVPESAQRFAAAIRDADNPIDLELSQEIYVGIIEKYGLRPTEPSAPFSNGHGGTGTSLMDTASPSELIPETSGSSDYSTSSTGDS